MTESIAILGRQPALGLAELESLYGADHVRTIAHGVAQLPIDPCAIDCARLGGTVKLCKVLERLKTTSWKDVESFLVKVAPPHAVKMPSGKMRLGLSVYGIDVTVQQLTATGLKLKKAIQGETGRSVRVVPNQKSELNAAQVIHNKLTTDTGWELVAIRSDSTITLAQTVFVQDIGQYSRRDFGRPKRDARVGMLPPKLAQLIINLAAGPQEYETTQTDFSGDACLQQEDMQRLHSGRSGFTVLDPFCGTGVVLQEALLMGFNAYGTDIERRMCEFTQINLEWLAQTTRIVLPAYRLTTGDATTFRWQPPFHMIASETYLGRPFTSTPTAEVLAQTMADCNLILKKFLKNLQPQLTGGTRLCLAIPAWQVRPGIFRYLPLVDQLTDIGYNRISFKHVRDQDLLYYRNDQIVARQLLLITKE